MRVVTKDFPETIEKLLNPHSSLPTNQIGDNPITLENQGMKFIIPTIFFNFAL